MTTVRRLKEAGGPGGLVFGNVGLFSRTPDAIGISDMHQAAAVLSPALQTLEPEKQERSRRSRGGSLMHGAGAGEEGQNRQRKEGAEERKRITVGGASSEADLVGCQFKHGSFLPKKVPNQF